MDGTKPLNKPISETNSERKKLKAEKSKFEVKTPTSVVGVRGTAFSVKVDEIPE